MSRKSLLAIFATLAFLLSFLTFVSCGKKKDKDDESSDPVITLKGAAI